MLCGVISNVKYFYSLTIIIFYRWTGVSDPMILTPAPPPPYLFSICNASFLFQMIPSGLNIASSVFGSSDGNPVSNTWFMALALYSSSCLTFLPSGVFSASLIANVSAQLLSCSRQSSGFKPAPYRSFS